MAGAAALAAARAETRADLPGFFDLAVTGGASTYEAMGLVPEERGVALVLLARQLYSQGTGGAERASRRLTAILSEGPAPAGAQGREPQAASPFYIAAPLTADAWRDALEAPSRGDLFAMLAANRAALLTASGAMAADPSIRALLERDRALLKWIVRTAPGTFAIAARSLRVARDRIDVPGGAAFEPMWEALVAEKVTRPADFVRALLTKDSGRLAWFFDTFNAMGAERLSAVLPVGPVEARAEGARALYGSFREAEQNWRLEDHPFLRSAADPWIVATEVGARDGALAAPSWQWLWRAVFEDRDLSRREAASIARSPAAPAPFAWVAQQITSELPRERRDRYEMVRLAQAAFAGAGEADATDILVTLGGYRRFRAVLLMLDRLEITAPRVYARAVDAARRIDARPGREQRPALVALQGAFAIIERARVSRAIDRAGAERLVLSLADAVDRDAPMPQAVAHWIEGPLFDALPPLVQPDQWTGKTAYESKILQALAGPAEDADLPQVEWEGLPYTVDLLAAERERITRIREQLVSPGLDEALASGQPARLADALMALVYAPALGDPEGPALLSRDIATRHDFGLDSTSATRRDVLAWFAPRDQVTEGVPWHIEGSLLGLDLGLARLSLRRVNDNDMPVAPTINLNDELTLARTAVAINPRDLTDADRAALVEAIARGRARVASAGRNLPALSALASEARLPVSVRQALPWTVTRTPEAIPAPVLAARFAVARPPVARPGGAQPLGRLQRTARRAVAHRDAAARRVGHLRRPCRWRRDRHAGAGPHAAPRRRDRAAQAARAARPGAARVRHPGLLARRPGALPGRLAGDGQTSTGAFAVAGRRLRGGAGRHRPAPSPVNRVGPLSRQQGPAPCACWKSRCRCSVPLGVLALALVGLPAQQPPDLAIRVVAPETDTYVSGPTLLKAAVVPGARASEVSQVLFFADGRQVCNVMDPIAAECTWDAGAEVRPHTLRVVAQLWDGGRLVASARTKGLDHAESVRVEVVQITAVVTDHGRFVPGLPATAFTLTEDGVPQAIEHFSAEGSPLEIVVAIDVSESMTQAMPQLKNAVKKFLAALGPKDQVTLAAFNDNMFTLTRRETSAPLRLKAVDRLAPWGGTALYDVIIRGVQQLSRQAGRRVLVVFSDGDDRTSHATIQAVEEAVRANDATLFMVALGRGVREAQLKSGIERLVDLSGGRVLFVERSEQLEGPFQAILEELSNQYIVGYQSTNPRRNGTWREVRVDVPGTRYSVRARQGYKAPGAER